MHERQDEGAPSDAAIGASRVALYRPGATTDDVARHLIARSLADRSRADRSGAETSQLERCRIEPTVPGPGVSKTIPAFIRRPAVVGMALVLLVAVAGALVPGLRHRVEERPVRAITPPSTMSNLSIAYQ